MKKFLLFLSLNLVTALGFSQHETLFGQENVFGFFGGPIVEYNIDNDEVTTSVGGGGALILGNLFIGGYGLASADQLDNLIDNSRVDLQLAHGGFWVGAVYPSNKLLHAFTSVKMGWGGLDLEISEDNWRSNDAVFVTTPEIGVEVNLLKFFRIAGTAGYRFVGGVNNSGNLGNSDFSNFVAAITFRFGAFGCLRNNNRWDNDEKF